MLNCERSGGSWAIILVPQWSEKYAGSDPTFKNTPQLIFLIKKIASRAQLKSSSQGVVMLDYVNWPHLPDDDRRALTYNQII